MYLDRHEQTDVGELARVAARRGGWPLLGLPFLTASTLGGAIALAPVSTGLDHLTDRRRLPPRAAFPAAACGLGLCDYDCWPFGLHPLIDAAM